MRTLQPKLVSPSFNQMKRARTVDRTTDGDYVKVTYLLSHSITYLFVYPPQEEI